MFHDGCNYLLINIQASAEGKTMDGFVITLSKVATIKFLTEEGLACEIEDDP